MKRGADNSAPNKLGYAFAAMPTAILDDGRLDALDVRAYGILLSIDTDRNGIVKISESRLGDRLFRKIDAARRSLRRLESSGWIKAIDHGDGVCREYKLKCHPYAVSASAPSETGRKTETGGYADLSELYAAEIREEAAEKAALAILEACWPLVEAEHDLGFSKKEWLAQNDAAARSLVEVGKTAEEAAELLTVAYEDPDARKYYGRITRLDKLKEHWHALVSIAEGPEETEAEIDDRRIHGDCLPRY